VAGYEVMHSGRFVLIDRQGRIRVYYDGPALEPDRVVRDIRNLMREQ
jgi:cytochrome oxidase Cu insertion factor (SCO1/SenC/PrrC family)